MKPDFASALRGLPIRHPVQRPQYPALMLPRLAGHAGGPADGNKTANTASPSHSREAQPGNRGCLVI
jgi:hypothetical protein